ncbi:uncharacterized protein SCHCODRAFT_01331830 [Schizophyllum commune H4-8]|uniref:uncharacterized protein n=1 Tax=Schizophyllum commune (strain H4-8 / FGSC 9210) TaxID=578458 RepID=UPI00215FBB70|nr:uncharacterized protein SCHCODRAFT_01331830 [Schizophyllum commune H4-8]KAI5888480.1 hypothetical protein SCHCODRAFT_01331830 [Schizophyllum commune H4-8]
MDSARVAIPILYICWNVFSVNLFSFVLLVDSSNVLCDVLPRFMSWEAQVAGRRIGAGEQAA